MSDPADLALLLITRVPAGVRAALTAEPAEAVNRHFGLSVIEKPASEIGGSCNIQGRYLRDESEIWVSDELIDSAARFTILHELGHHLAQHDPEVARALDKMAGHGLTAEERVASRFAAELAMPADDVAAVASSISAVAVHELWTLTGASRSACCRRIAERMTGNGYVVLAREGVVQSAAVVGNAFPIGRDAAQDAGDFLADASGVDSLRRSPARIRQPSGVQTSEYSADAVRALDGYVFAVFTDLAPPPWGGYVGPLDTHPLGIEMECQRCDADRIAWKRCSGCRGAKCPSCDWCACRPVARMETRLCSECFIRWPLSHFADDSTVCREHE